MRLINGKERVADTNAGLEGEEKVRGWTERRPGFLDVYYNVMGKFIGMPEQGIIL